MSTNDQPRIEFLTGPAGTGKTTEVRRRIMEAEASNGRNYGTLSATTGIAAVNLGAGVTTVNSVLKFFNTEQLVENYAEGKLTAALGKVANLGGNLIIDEVSMMEATQLDMIHLAWQDLNKQVGIQKAGGLGIVLTGDFCQLPPVQGKYAFHAKCWDTFIAPHITKLTKVWRQDNPQFLAAINAARCGDGTTTASILQDLSTTEHPIFGDTLNIHFDGTTICAKNADVDRINNVRYLDLITRQDKVEITIPSHRWGVQRGEWKLIPPELALCKDAYVMILANNPPEYDYANGDCGMVQDVAVGGGKAFIKLKRNGVEVTVRKITRKVMEKERPWGISAEVVKVMTKGEWKESSLMSGIAPEDFTSVDMEYARYLRGYTVQQRGTNLTSPYYDYEEKKWVVGEITYMPLRLAYACTVHKTQGLTLDAVQIDPYNKFFGEPSMMYVALSRVRSHEGLRVVGSPRLLEERTNVLREILEWL